MLDWMLTNPWFSAAMVMAFMGLVCIVPFYLLSKFKLKEISPDTRDIAASVVFRIGTLHALILALIFSGTQEEYQKARETIVAEVIILSEVVYEIAQIESVDLSSTLDKIRDYIDALEQDDAPALALRNLKYSDILFNNSSQLSNEIYKELVGVESAERRDELAINRIITKLDKAFSLRLDRVASSARGISNLFWILAFAGFMFVVLLLYFVPFSWANAFVISVYGAYTGLTLFFIVEMNNPYLGLSSIDLAIVVEVFQAIESKIQ